MTSRIDDLRARIDALHAEIDSEIARRRETFRYRIEKGRVRFEDEALRHQRAFRMRLDKFLALANPRHIATAPVIYSLIFPFALLDLFVTIYQAICFPAYGIPKVRRRDYIRIDRHHLAYLNALQKMNCIYCGYCNGLIAYVREIAGRTEAFWCPIKHAARIVKPHDRYEQFLDYGDAENYQDGLAGSRRKVTGRET